MISTGQSIQRGRVGSRPRAIAWLATVCIAWVMSGCGERESASTTEFELRGEPIAAVAKPADTNPPAPSVEGEPIASPAPTASASASTPPSAPAETETAAATTAEPAADAGPASGYQVVGFDKLSSYEFQVSDELLNPPTNATINASAQTDAQIPKEIKALDQKKVAVKGFMLPLKVVGGRVTELLIMKDQSMCCYGAVPKINEWVSVKMVDEGVKPLMDQPITLYGKLNVGEMRENGYLVGIYSMDGDMMADPLDQ